MQTLLYWVALGLIRAVQALPLTWVARLGRSVGSLVYWLDARHRRVASRNIAMCFPELGPAETRALAKENFRRIGENFACAVKTAGMDFETLRKRVEFDAPALTVPVSGQVPPRAVVAIGHFGNFELFARYGQFANVSGATTYRGLRQPGFNKLLQSLRQRSGCLYFERRSDAAALRAFMNRDRIALGLLVDQHAGDGGIPLPFFGRQCSTSAAPALFALRYNCRLFTGFCFRTGLARWRLESFTEIATHEAGKPRPLAEIMLDVNRVFEAAVRRDPANWFWVHNRWKLKWRKPRAGVKQEVAAAPLTNGLERSPRDG